MGNNLTKIFVYGSLRSGFQSPAYEYISKYFTLVSEAKVKGRLYDMGSYPAAVPTEDEVYITGELYDLKNPEDFAWAIEQIDAYEGVNPEEGEPVSYVRDRVQVYYADQTTEAWVYWYKGNIDDQPQIVSGDIFDFIHQKSKF
jgi:gamma-glutamylcyclotransferase (GGCT)/AIG2-like uncharacterized protein YtfP